MVAFERPELTELKPRITVIGVGGAGGNAVANMIDSDLEGVEFVVANTDAQALASSRADTRIQLGHRITQGLGAGARPEIGRAAAEENIDELEAALEGAHMCFITAGMGGGTGTGAAPVIAETARERGILTVGVVTKPFSFEGAKRARAAESGIAELQKHVDTLIVIPNQNLFMLASPQTTFKEAFALADQVLHQGVRGITDLMMMPGLINLDFADVRTVMSEMGKAMMGTGEAEGDNRAIEAAEKAVSNPLLDEVSLRGAKALLINITGGDDMGLMEVDEAANHIRDMVDADANIIFGSAFNPDLNGKLRVSVVATGIDSSAREEGQPSGQGQRSAFGSVASGFGGMGSASTSVRPAPAPARAEPAPRPVDPEPEAHIERDEAEPETAHDDYADEIVEDEETAADVYASEEEEAEAIVPAHNVTPLRPPLMDSLLPEDALETGEDEAATEAQAPAQRMVPPQAEERSEPRPEPRVQPQAEAPQPRADARLIGDQPARGPSLFERMAAIGRGSKEEKKDLFGDDDDNDGDPLEIPAFFRQQVND